MATINNQTIRNASKSAKVRHWQIAEVLGIAEADFSRKLRHELPTEEQEKILAVIKKISAEDADGNEE